MMPMGDSKTSAVVPEVLTVPETQIPYVDTGVRGFGRGIVQIMKEGEARGTALSEVRAENDQLRQALGQKDATIAEQAGRIETLTAAQWSLRNRLSDVGGDLSDANAELGRVRHQNGRLLQRVDELLAKLKQAEQRL